VIIYELSRDLFVSTFPRPGDKAKLDELGVTALLCLVRRAPPAEVTAGLWTWRHLPLPDGNTVPDDVDEAVKWVIEQVTNDETVLVHCMSGRNRAALVAGLATMTLEGWTGFEAYANIMALRPNALHNQVFADYLRGRP
jgi:protein-tyrosine phosphatase